jgi:predicted oxidoreductase (fatty acid repression mutant protein)
MQKQFEPYAQDFPVWANQANGMLQIILWTALREQGIGANIQHDNPGDKKGLPAGEMAVNPN